MRSIFVISSVVKELSFITKEKAKSLERNTGFLRHILNFHKKIIRK